MSVSLNGGSQQVSINTEGSALRGVSIHSVRLSRSRRAPSSPMQRRHRGRSTV
jgi:hypothetical protein